MSNHPPKPESFERDQKGLIATQAPAERAVLAQLIVDTPRSDKIATPEIEDINPLEELEGLSEAAGAKVVDRVVQKRSQPHPATLFGSGKSRGN